MDNNTNNTYENTPQYETQYTPQQPMPQNVQVNVYHPDMEEPVSLGDWVGTLLLLNFVPCIGFILCIVWAFSKNTKKSKANFCKAYLILYLIGIVLGVIMGIAFGGMFAALMSEVGYYY